MNTKDYWLKPDGKLIEVPMFGHDDYAQNYLEKECSNDEEYGALLERMCEESAYSIMHQRGWIRIKTSASGKLEIIGDSISLVSPQRNTIDPAMNSKQLRTAKRLCKEHDTLFHEAINDKRFW